MKEYAVIIEKGVNCWGAYVPDLPGLAATGSTPQEVEQLIRDGIEIHLGAMLQDSDVIPEPTTRVLTIHPEVLDHQLAKSA